ncbi:sensor histidine kinase [Brevibacillus choshinensis]|uniref:histidine kinase n=1 Tax=Brevibacillus choshinensis TaxID=54911 RepID=A0ABX7FXT3_BRECH|nr:sensor histidine kinase [Brevibacillus choshinensis]QRG70637.1 sensor histidine kinase [Brevibacillus choshinensis]
MSLKAIQKRLLIIWFSVLIILSLIPNSFMRETPLQFFTTMVLFFLYIVLFWASKKNWKPFQIELVTILLGSLSLLKSVFVGGEGFGMMLPLAVFIGFHIEGKRSLAYATFFGVCTTLSMYFEEILPIQHIIPFILTYMGCYIGARGYRIQNTAYQMNQQHLEELQKAHSELQEAHDQLQEAALHTMQVAVLEERTRIARDIHDALGHSLTSLIVQLQAVKYMLQDGPPLAQEAVRNMLGVAKQSLEEIRSSVHTLAMDKTSLGLSPLRALLSQAEKHTGVKMELVSDDLDITLSQEATITFYRILQEAVTNSLRHSDAKKIEVALEHRGNTIFFSIRDDGSITKEKAVKPGFGLNGISERLQKLNGRLRYFVRDPHGFQIDVEIPLTPFTQEGSMRR